MKELRGISSKLLAAVEKLKEDKDIEEAVEKLLLIKDELKKIVKESTQI